MESPTDWQRFSSHELQTPRVLLEEIKSLERQDDFEGNKNFKSNSDNLNDG